MAQVYELSHFDFWRKLGVHVYQQSKYCWSYCFKAARTKADCVCVCVLHFVVRIYRAMKVRSIICPRYRHKETLWQILATEQIFKFLSPNAAKISGFGVPAVVHKIACDWERVGIKSASFKLLRVKFFDDRRVLRRTVAGTRIFT